MWDLTGIHVTLILAKVESLPETTTDELVEVGARIDGSSAIGQRLGPYIRDEVRVEIANDEVGSSNAVLSGADVDGILVLNLIEDDGSGQTTNDGNKASDANTHDFLWIVLDTRRCLFGRFDNCIPS
jgi:hypothetical protein